MEWKIEKQSAIPLYFQLKQLVLGGIEQGILSPGDMIPTEQELSAMLGISRPTIRQALGELVNEGYLTRVKSKGTFISSPKLDAQFFQRLQPFAQELEQKGRTPSTQVLSLEKSEARPDANAALELDKNAPLLHLKRLRAADGEPVVLVETFLPYFLFKGLLKEDLTHQSLYELLDARYNVHIAYVRREIEAVNAMESQSRLLKCAKNSALMKVVTTGYDTSRRPMEYSIAHYRGDRNRFTVTLCR